MSSKELALKTIREMPEETTLDDIAEEMLMLAAIRKGEADADAGRVISHEEMKKRIASWNTK
jgi:predicted transcriptional regulator